MSYVPIGSSSDTSIDTTGVEATPETPFMAGIGIDLEDSLMGTFSGMGIYQMRKWYRKHYNPGEFLTGDEIKEKYPNMSIPNGGYENVIKLKSDRKAAHDFADEVVGNLSPGFFSYGARLGQFFLANSTDPIQLLMGKGISALISKPMGYLAGKLPELTGISETAARFGVGAAEGMVHALPYVGLQAYEGKEIQEPLTAMAAITTLGLGGFLGSLYRTVAGFKEIVPDESKQTMVEIAKDQIKSGKTVDVELIMKDTLYKTFEKEPLTKESILERRTMLEKDSDVISTRIEEEQAKVTEKINKTRGKIGKKLFTKALGSKNLKSFLKKLTQDEKTGNFIFQDKIFTKDKINRVFKSAKKTTKNLNKLLGVSKDIQQVIENTDNYISILETNKGTVTPLELSQKIKNINSWRGNEITYIDDMNKSDKIVSSPEANLDQTAVENKSFFDDLKKADQLDEHEKEELWKSDKDDSRPALLQKVINKTIQCLTGVK